MEKRKKCLTKRQAYKCASVYKSDFMNAGIQHMMICKQYLSASLGYLLRYSSAKEIAGAAKLLKIAGLLQDKDITEKGYRYWIDEKIEMVAKEKTENIIFID